MLYNLTTSQTDRIKFDEVQKRYAKAVLNTLSQDVAMAQVPKEYAEVGWEAFEIDLEQRAVVVDDLKEAKVRFMKVFVRTVKEWQENKKRHIVISAFEGRPVVSMTVNQYGEQFQVLAEINAYADLNGIYNTAKDIENVMLLVRTEEIAAGVDDCIVKSEDEVKVQVHDALSTLQE